MAGKCGKCGSSNTNGIRCGNCGASLANTGTIVRKKNGGLTPFTIKALLVVSAILGASFVFLVLIPLSDVSDVVEVPVTMASDFFTRTETKTGEIVHERTYKIYCTYTIDGKVFTGHLESKYEPTEREFMAYYHAGRPDRVEIDIMYDVATKRYIFFAIMAACLLAGFALVKVDRVNSKPV